MKKTILVAILVLLVLVSACSKTETPAVQQESQPELEKKGDEKGASIGGENAQITIKGFKFTPGEIRVKAGAVVTWKNEDGVAHTVEANDGSFTSDNLEQGDTVSFTFDKPGRFDYFCGPHPSMTGAVIVE